MSATEMEDQFIGFSQLRETEIIISSQWILQTSSGYEMLQTLMKMTNDQYNFKSLIQVVDSLASDILFCKLPSIGFSEICEIG